MVTFAHANYCVVDPTISWGFQLFRVMASPPREPGDNASRYWIARSRMTEGDPAMAPRRPRDIDAELRALQDKARLLRNKQKAQLGELLLATGATDALDADALAGLLLHGLEQAKANPQAAESWRLRGQAFFRRERATDDTDRSTTPAVSRAPRRTAEDTTRPAAE
jgi:hypothetical protein